MSFRISPLWWPLLTLAGPLLGPALLIKHRRFMSNLERARLHNRDLAHRAEALPLPGLDHLTVQVILDAAGAPGFDTAPGISYFLETDRGCLLFDMGFGDERPALANNLRKLSPDLKRAEAVVISHLHPDHMGGLKAVKQRRVPLPKGTADLRGKPCWVPEPAVSRYLEMCRVDRPRMIAAGVGTTGPLARSLFLMGPVREQALLAKVHGKGLVVITGCGHPTIRNILKLVRQVSDEKIYAVVGGLHLPVTDSPYRLPGLKVQMIWGTGKPPWQRITDRDVDRTVAELNRAGVEHLYISPHDICGHAIRRLDAETNARVTCLEAGRSYHF